MNTLGNRSGSRDNNLNLIRMLAATGVLVSHAWPISLGAGVVQPLQNLTGYSLGTLCVYVFFVISGFLIAGSFENARSTADFLAARILRLMPGLVVSLALVAFVMGPLTTSLPVAAYLTDSGTWTFMVRNTLLAAPQFTLPGVFEANPYPTVEGSIWTLIHEVACYTGLLIAGLSGLLARRAVATGLIIAYTAFWLFAETAALPLHPRIDSFLDLSVPFAIGTLMYLWRGQIRLSAWLVLALVAAAAFTRGTPGYPLMLVLALSYAVFWCAYVPGGVLRRYNAIGDYSYGLYIYAFPAQGLAIWALGPMTPLENILWSFPLTLVPSVLSWHMIEKPALSARHRVADMMRTGIVATAGRKS